MAVDAEVAGKGNATSRHEPDVEQVDERDLDEGTASDLAGRLEIRDNPVSRSYDAVLDGTVVAMIVCEDDGTRRAFDHTVVDPEHRGRGITTMLVKAALDDLRAKEPTLTNYCRFVADFIVGHPRLCRSRRREPLGRCTQALTGAWPVCSTAAHILGWGEDAMNSALDGIEVADGDSVAANCVRTALTVAAFVYDDGSTQGLRTSRDHHLR
jgi:predicted GNAT family acetyltransferase